LEVDRLYHRIAICSFISITSLVEFINGADGWMIHHLASLLSFDTLDSA
jgi:hypothetical protein